MSRLSIKVPKSVIKDIQGFFCIYGQILLQRSLKNTKSLPTQEQLQTLRQRVDILCKHRRQFNIGFHYMYTNDDFSIKKCDDCGQVDLSSHLWTPFCGHLICRLCIDKTLKNDFNYNVMDALESKCFCSKCRLDGNEQTLEQYFQDLKAWKKRNPKKMCKQELMYNVAPQSDDEDQKGDDDRGPQNPPDDQQKDPEPAKSDYGRNQSQIRPYTIQNLFPILYSRYQKKLEEKKKKDYDQLVEMTKSYKKCKICRQQKKNDLFVSLTPCSHTMCKDCLYKDFSQKIEQNQVSRHSLVCPICQKLIHFPNITFILGDNIHLKSRLEKPSEYNFYHQQEACPKCDKLMFWDENHQDQACLNCNYEFCKNCLTTTHQGKTCQEAIDSHREQVKNDATTNFMKNTQSYGVCPDCITYGKRLLGSDAGLCIFCKKIFCISCYMMIDKSHKCDSPIPLEVYEVLGGNGKLGNSQLKLGQQMEKQLSD